MGGSVPARRRRIPSWGAAVIAIAAAGLVGLGPAAGMPTAVGNRPSAPALGAGQSPDFVAESPCFLDGIARSGGACGSAAGSGGATPLLTGGSRAGPSARYGAAEVYDSGLGALLLFGGINATGGLLDDTWEYAGGHWTQLTPASHPGPRAYAAVAYDAKGGYVVLFGGLGATASGGYTDLSDTWTFAGGQWTRLSVSVHPVARYGMAMTYDSSAMEVLAFGGVSVNFTSYAGTTYSDTWTFAGGAWTKLSLTVHPSARGGAGLTYDTTAGYAVLFGGCGYPSGFCGEALHDTWKFASGTWRRFSFAAPSHEYGLVALANDPANGTVVLFGGADNSTVLGSTWTLDSTGWIRWMGSPSPSAMAGTALAYDPSAAKSTGGAVVLFGGVQPFVPTTFDQTWVFGSGAWKKA